MARKSGKAAKGSGSLLVSIQDTFRRALSCCGSRKKRLVIQAPTDFRREEVKFDMSSMNADQRAFIRSLTFINTTPATITPSTQNLTAADMTPASHFSSTTTSSPASTPCPTPAQTSPSRMDRVITRTTRRLSVHIPHVASPLRPLQSAYQAVEDHNSSVCGATPGMQSQFESDSSSGTRCSEDSGYSRESFESLELADGKIEVRRAREVGLRSAGGGCCCGDSVCERERVVGFEKVVLRKT